MSTFEQLIKADLSALALAKVAGLRVEGGVAQNVRVFTTARDFDPDYDRICKTEPVGDPPTAQVLRATALVTVEAVLRVITETAPLDIEDLLAELLATDYVVWSWRGLPIRVDRVLRRTRLAQTEPTLTEDITIAYSAPYFVSREVPIIADASYFDAWTYGVEEPAGGEE